MSSSCRSDALGLKANGCRNEGGKKQENAATGARFSDEERRKSHGRKKQVRNPFQKRSETLFEAYLIDAAGNLRHDSCGNLLGQHLQNDFQKSFWKYFCKCARDNCCCRLMKCQPYFRKARSGLTKPVIGCTPRRTASSAARA